MKINNLNTSHPKLQVQEVQINPQIHQNSLS